jgi:hypothetical protein
MYNLKKGNVNRVCGNCVRLPVLSPTLFIGCFLGYAGVICRQQRVYIYLANSYPTSCVQHIVQVLGIRVRALNRRRWRHEKLGNILVSFKTHELLTQKALFLYNSYVGMLYLPTEYFVAVFYAFMGCLLCAAFHACLLLTSVGIADLYLLLD